MNESGLNSQSILRRLRHRVRSVEQEDRNLLVGLLADIQRPMNTGTRLVPLNLTGRDLNALALASVAVFD